MNTFQEYLKSQEGNEGALWLVSGARFNTRIEEAHDDYILITDKDNSKPLLAFHIKSIASWQPEPKNSF